MAMRSARARSSPTCTVKRTPTSSTPACLCWRDPSRSSLAKIRRSMGRATPAACPRAPCTRSTPRRTACATSPAGARCRGRPLLNSKGEGEARRGRSFLYLPSALWSHYAVSDILMPAAPMEAPGVLADRLAQRREEGVMVSLDINGKRQNVDVPGETPLLWTLRDELGLTGSK